MDHHHRLYSTIYGALRWAARDGQYKRTNQTVRETWSFGFVFHSPIQFNWTDYLLICSLDCNYYWNEFIWRLSLIYRLLWQFFHLFYLINSLSYDFEWRTPDCFAYYNFVGVFFFSLVSISVTVRVLLHEICDFVLQCNFLCCFSFFFSYFVPFLFFILYFEIYL